MPRRRELHGSKNFGASFGTGNGKWSQSCILICTSSVGKDSVEQGLSVPCEITVVQVGEMKMLHEEMPGAVIHSCCPNVRAAPAVCT